MWLGPAGTGHNIVWLYSWPEDVTLELVSLTKTPRMISNSDLKLAALVLQKTTLLWAVPKARMAAPRSGSDNTPTVSWCTHEASMFKPVVADLHRIRMLHFRFFFLTLLFFTTQAKKTAWQIMLPACPIYLTPHFLPTYLSSTPSCTVRGRSPSLHRDCFPV